MHWTRRNLSLLRICAGRKVPLGTRTERQVLQMVRLTSGECLETVLRPIPTISPDSFLERISLDRSLSEPAASDASSFFPPLIFTGILLPAPVSKAELAVFVARSKFRDTLYKKDMRDMCSDGLAGFDCFLSSPITLQFLSSHAKMTQSIPKILPQGQNFRRKA